MGQEQFKDLIQTYQDRKKRSEDQYRIFKERIKNARDAYKQKIPQDIAKAASNQYLMTGNQGINDDGNCSMMLIPMFTAIAKKGVENLTAMPPRYEWDANNRESVKTTRALEKELVQFFTKMNIGKHTPLLMHHFLVSGMFAQQTIFRKMVEKVTVYKEGRETEEIIYNGGAIDFVLYDPLTCYFDWDADLSDMTKTSKFCIVTISSNMSLDEIKRRYGKVMEQQGISPMTSNAQTDVLKTQLQSAAGLTPDVDTYIVREYYTNDGKFYTIINDSFVARWGYASNGVRDQIPINIGVAFIDPDNNCGYPLWEFMKWPIAAMSNAFNQVADNNAFNNTSPIFMLGSDLAPLVIDTADGRKIFQLNPTNPQMIDIRGMIQQLTIPEVTQGAVWMYQQAKESLFYVTGTNDMAFGIQDKQIRNQDVANMIGDSLVRSDSDIAKKIEVSFYNPVTWDILRIFYSHYDDFSFQKEVVPRDFLKNYRSVRVINGSYLAADKSIRLGKLMQALELSKLVPERANLEELFYDLYEAIGFADPYRYLKTQEEFVAEQFVMAVTELMQAGQIDQEQGQQMIQSIQVIQQKKEQFQGAGK
jgi:hypothetical protein